MSDSERRARPRLKTLITTGVTAPSPDASDDAPSPATCLDLSDTGMVFAFRRAIRVGSGVIVTLQLPSGNINAYAIVLRYEPTRRKGWWQIAVKFDGLFEDDQQRIAAYVLEERKKRVF
jgi:hypothetical protein